MTENKDLRFFSTFDSVTISLCIFFLVTSSLYLNWKINYDNDSRKSQYKKIARVTQRDNDVKHKFIGEKKWKELKDDTDIYLDSVVYTDVGSSAEIQFLNENSVIKLKESTLISFIKKDKKSFLNIEYGEVRGQLSKSLNIIHNNKHITMSGKNSQYKISISKNNKIKIASLKGSLNIIQKNKKVKLVGNQTLEIDKNKYKTFNSKILLITPKKSKRIAADNNTIRFRWSKDKRYKKYKIHISTNKNFSPDGHQTALDIKANKITIKIKTTGKHYWKVTTVYKKKKISSAVRNFSILSTPVQVTTPKNNPKSKITVISPISNQTYTLPIATKISLKWKKVATKSIYKIIMATNKSLSQVILKKVVSKNYFRWNWTRYPRRNIYFQVSTDNAKSSVIRFKVNKLQVIALPKPKPKPKSKPKRSKTTIRAPKLMIRNVDIKL